MTSRTEKNKKVRKKLIRQEKHEIRKEKFIKFLKIFTCFLIITLSIVSYIYYESTATLTIREYKITNNKLPNEMHGFKIVQVGDLYYDNNYKNILKTLEKNINKLKPDLVIFTGNLKNKYYKLTNNDLKLLENTFKNITSTTGKYYITGSNDNEEIIDLLNKNDFKYLDNTQEEIYYNSSKPIILTGITDKYDYDYSKYKDNLQITLINNPDNIDNIKNSQDIIMSGKYLNSQIRFPYIGALINRNKKYIEPTYNKDNTSIFITGGIGTDNLPIRLFNHPSINFYRLTNK